MRFVLSNQPEKRDAATFPKGAAFDGLDAARARRMDIVSRVAASDRVEIKPPPNPSAPVPSVAVRVKGRRHPGAFSMASALAALSCLRQRLTP